MGALEDADEIESSEVVLLQPHGGEDLAGFSLIRGSGNADPRCHLYRVRVPSPPSGALRTAERVIGAFDTLNA